MVGRRWDTEITDAICFSADSWQADILNMAQAANHQRSEWYIDYFVFSRGFYEKQIPPLVIGRVFGTTG
jgi:hypothetical protein